MKVNKFLQLPVADPLLIAKFEKEIKRRKKRDKKNGSMVTKRYELVEELLRHGFDVLESVRK